MFAIDGAAVLAGPAAAEKACALGLECVISVEGAGLQATNRIRVLAEGDCSDAVSAEASWEGATKPDVPVHQTPLTLQSAGGMQRKEYGIATQHSHRKDFDAFFRLIVKRREASRKSNKSFPVEWINIARFLSH